MFHAVTDMILQYLFLQSTQCCPRCSDLRDDIDAISVFFDHPMEAAYLPFNPVQPLHGFRLDVLPHGGYIPLPGTRYNP